MHLNKHTKNTDVEPLFLNPSDCFIKVQTANIIVNVGLSKYSSFYMGNLRLNDEQWSWYFFHKYIPRLYIKIAL